MPAPDYYKPLVPVLEGWSQSRTRAKTVSSADWDLFKVKKQVHPTFPLSKFNAALATI